MIEMPAPSCVRIALGIEYDGSSWHGWQRQQGLQTIQGCLEDALSFVANHPVETVCAGRTDAGVHAFGQVIHFESHAKRSERAWILGTNSRLPPAIVVRWAMPVHPSFSARFSAVSRRYLYVILNQRTRSAIFVNRATYHPIPLNAEKMHQAAQYLLGERDFSSFRSSECESISPMRCVHAISVYRHHDFVVMDIQANAFLHHMVRNIAGVLIRIGEERAPVEWAEQVLFAKDRRQAAETAKPTGLYLADVEYPVSFGIPRTAFDVFSGVVSLRDSNT